MQGLKFTLCLAGLFLSFAVLARASGLRGQREGPSKADIAIAMVEGMGVAVNSIAQEVDRALSSIPVLTPAPLPESAPDGDEDTFLDFEMSGFDLDALEPPAGPIPQHLVHP